MKKILMLLVSFCYLFGFNIDYSENSVNISGNVIFQTIEDDTYTTVVSSLKNYTTENGNEIPFQTYLLSLPNSGNYVVETLKFDTEFIQLKKPLSIKKNEVYSKRIKNSDIVVIGEPVIAGGNRFVQVTIYPFYYEPSKKELSVVKNFDLTLKLDQSITNNCAIRQKTKSSSLKNLMRTNLIGYQDDRFTSKYRGVYAFVYPDQVEQYLAYYRDWKESMGYKVIMLKKSEIGNTTESIKSKLSEIYYNDENGLDYAILFGDVDGELSIPAFYVEGYMTETDVSDHSYSLVDGDDYFSDFLVGRISFDTIQTLGSTIVKLINYDKAPNVDNSDWFTRSILTAYGESDNYNGEVFNSTILNQRQNKLKLEDIDFCVDTLFTMDNSIDPSILQNMINEGCSLLGYRGFGGSNSWVLDFDIDDIDNLNNGSMLPFVTSIVCGGGDYADQVYPVCFGEKWLTAGTVNTPKGAIGFVGPSEHDTKTPFNNCNNFGIYQGFTHEGIDKCGEMMFRGKMELYNNYPTMHNWGNALNSDQFYFYVYNLLGDPGIVVKSSFPQQLSMEIIQNPSIGNSVMTIKVLEDNSPSEDAWVTLKNSEGIVCSFKSDNDGFVNIFSDFENLNYTIWAVKDNTVPTSLNFDMTQQNNYLSIVSQSLNSIPIGVETELEIIIKNCSEVALENTVFNFESDDGLLFTNEQIVIGTISPNEEKILTSTVSLNTTWDSYDVCSFKILEENNNLFINGFMEVEHPELVFEHIEVLGTNSYLTQDNVNNFLIHLKNSGDIANECIEINIFKKSNNFEILSESSTIQPIAPSEFGCSDINFSVNIPMIWDGDVLFFGAELRKEEMIFDTIYFNIPVGVTSQNSATRSNYGYIAIEDKDEIYGYDVNYNWLELNPNIGGCGNEIYETFQNTDGTIYFTNLPFNFKYYGTEYDNISICSNGYVVMGRSSILFFRNRLIPSGSGPRNMIAPFWDGLTNGKVFVYNNVESHEYYIEWFNFKSTFDVSSNNSFQLVLRDPEYYPTEVGDSEILFIYKEISNIDALENYATIGLENYNENEGLLLSYSNIYPETMHEVSNESAILITQRLLTSTGIKDNLPQETMLFGNYPNPFNPITSVKFFLDSDQNAKLIVYNSKGEKVYTSEKQFFCSGAQVLNFNGEVLSSGVYYYKLITDKKVFSDKMILLK
ncbi:MAG: T9SS type A sorting domain-containing protein [Candidatus Delongbacteria bacterium]|nr:T9SS type A sorting domain-containing protein [Candidatus Delongbacteria bacterium]MBN2835326.1 T9SS type A sorting domain-containing protein [Candidatus Delongbacteria bacterium]